MSSILARGSSTRELISPELAYRRYCPRSPDNGTEASESSPRAITDAISPESAP